MSARAAASIITTVAAKHFKNHIPAQCDYRIFMVRRSDASGFMAGSYVFPGGAVDAEDATHKWNNQSAEPDFAFRTAVIRELFEEAGILLTQPVANLPVAELAAARNAVHKDAKQFITFCAQHSLTPSTSDVYSWARWITPLQEKRRFDAMFYVTELDAIPEHAVHDGVETTESKWLAPDEAITEFYSGRIHLPPPTWMILSELLQYPRQKELIAHAKSTPRKQHAMSYPIQPHIVSLAQIQDTTSEEAKEQQRVLASLREAGSLAAASAYAQSFSDTLPQRVLLLPGDPLHPLTTPTHKAHRLLWFKQSPFYFLHMVDSNEKLTPRL